MTTRSAQPPAADSPAHHFLVKQSSPPYPSETVATSPPSKRDLTTWWKQFKRNGRKEDDKNGVAKAGIFGVPLNISIKYANVAISLNNEHGESFIYGYVPIVVAKCGVFLKEQATEVEGIFRLSGSARRIKELQEMFNSPERYGKGLDWTGYTVHDAANILRRYLNQLPEPIVPLDFYERFREPLRNHSPLPSSDQKQEASNIFNYEEAVLTYQRLIRELPPLNKQLLLYILDLLAVFASKSEKNRMTSANLAAIFQPGLLSHPSHDMAPDEYKLSQDVLIFLIENQDHFLFGMNGTATDPQIVKEFQSTAALNHNRTGVRRSVSNGSAGADGLRKYDTLRRNVSTSSKHSHRSSANHTPGTPPALGAGGVHRSNTVPSKKSPALSGPRADRNREQPKTPTSATLTPQYGTSRQGSRSPTARSPLFQPVPDTTTLGDHMEASGVPAVIASPAVTATTPSRERKLSSFFSKSPLLSTDPRETRPTNRLRKKRIPGSANASAQSSNQSLEVAGGEAAITSSALSLPTHPTSQPHQEATLKPVPPSFSHGSGHHHQPSESTLKANRSRSPSIRSRSSVTDHSDIDHPPDETTRGDRHHRPRKWRLSLHGKIFDEHSHLKSLNHSTDGQGEDVARENQANNSQQRVDTPSRNLSMTDSEPPVGKDGPKSPGAEKRGLFGKFKAKVAQMKEGSRDSDAERDRAKSPLRSDTEASFASSQSWSHVPKTGKRLSSEHTHESIEAVLDAPPSHPVPSTSPPVILEEPSTPIATVKELHPTVDEQINEIKPTETEPMETTPAEINPAEGVQVAEAVDPVAVVASAEATSEEPAVKDSPNTEAAITPAMEGTKVPTI